MLSGSIGGYVQYERQSRDMRRRGPGDKGESVLSGLPRCSRRKRSQVENRSLEKEWRKGLRQL